MLSFEEGFIESQQLNQRLLQTIRLVGEIQGKAGVVQATSATSFRHFAPSCGYSDVTAS